MAKILAAGFHRAKCFRDNGDLDKYVYAQLMKRYVKLQLHTLIAPMQCIQAQSIAHTFHKLKEQGETSFMAELKYDGERMQIHVSDKITIFSKSGRNSTLDRLDTHPLIRASLGMIQPYFSLERPTYLKNVQQCILEAELLIFNDELGMFERFGTVHEFRKTDPNSRVEYQNRHVCVVFFDLLHLNGADLLDLPLESRRRALRDIIQPIPNFVFISAMERFQFSSGPLHLESMDGLRRHFDHVIQQAEEGLIIKGCQSHYYPGTRHYWLKMKPDYMKQLGDTAEFCILGGSYQPRNNYLGLCQKEYPYLLNTFFVGVLSNKQQVLNLGLNPRFEILFTVEAGFSRDVLLRFCQKYHLDRIPFSKSSENPFGFSFRLANSLPKMDYLFPPTIVTLKGSSFVQQSLVWVLRHPRLEGFPIDKTWQDVLDFDELQVLGEASAAQTLDPSKQDTFYNHLVELDREFISSKTKPKRLATPLNPPAKKYLSIPACIATPPCPLVEETRPVLVQSIPTPNQIDAPKIHPSIIVLPTINSSTSHPIVELKTKPSPSRTASCKALLDKTNEAISNSVPFKLIQSQEPVMRATETPSLAHLIAPTPQQLAWYQKSSLNIIWNLESLLMVSGKGCLQVEPHSHPSTLIIYFQSGLNLDLKFNGCSFAKTPIIIHHHQLVMPAKSSDTHGGDLEKLANPQKD